MPLSLSGVTMPGDPDTSRQDGSTTVAWETSEPGAPNGSSPVIVMSTRSSRELSQKFGELSKPPS